ncbi:MAG: glycosyltransferase [Clostridium sp.]|nr:glycosyltransferase [Clostridium sp.]
MKISIITIAYNSEKFIGDAIKSVMEQTVLMTDSTAAVEVEYLIIDGKSSDSTVKKAESYRAALEEKGVEYRIFSEPDEGIYDAMNKGIQLAQGDVIGILNSDDWYEPDTLETVAATFREKECEMMYANMRVHKTNGKTFVKCARLRKFETSRDWNHPTTFVRGDIYKSNLFPKKGLYDDYSFFLRMKKQGRYIVIVDKVLANFRMGGASNQKSLKAVLRRIKDRYKNCYRINGYSRWYMVECVIMEGAKWILG